MAYAVLSHYANSAVGSRDLSVAVALGPVALIGFVVISRATRLWVALLSAAVAALLVRAFWPDLVSNFPVVYLLQEAGFYSLMAATFGLSLRPGRVALCTMLADKVHGPLSAREVTYTRRVTAAWAVFFLAIALITIGFYRFAPLTTWSLFANFCVVPLMVLMFVGEYAVRRRVLPQVASRGMLAALHVYFGTSRHAP
ncbi:MAG TPA: hypothetical protein VHV81_06810 [Steroidobacteraceae bacterium]|nr:hypothetical protein [Steroidobacteraceae bacterium]